MYFNRSKGKVSMASESNLPFINPKDSPTSAIPIELAAAEENRMLRLRMMEMLDAWTNGKEPPSAILVFPELIPRMRGVTNISMTNLFNPYRYTSMPNNGLGMPSLIRP